MKDDAGAERPEATAASRVNYFLNGESRTHDGTLRLSEVVGEVRRGIAVAVDGVVVPRGRHAETVLDEGARVEIVTAVQGG